MFYFNEKKNGNFKFTNRKIRYPITLTKVDSSNNSKFLQGAEFELYQNMNGQIPDIKIGEYITDENGKITVDVPEGSYYFVEKTTPAGYRLAGDGRTTDVFVGMNAPQGSITITNEIIPISPGSGSSDKPEREKPEKEKPQEPIIKQEEPTIKQIEPVAVVVPPVIQEPVIEPKPQIKVEEEAVIPVEKVKELPKKTLPKTNGITSFIYLAVGLAGIGGGFIMKRKR